ncbi:dolichyl-phosphate-mannose-protein mannosyltransferase [Thamnocephalis sphaerospora]|uniref:Dolichyl-phosphate-mannose--protein mannosyltransferase n=1 Tax=Thamnocephalis sphaerospora TaxID=78915 RepID=A0A4P9XUG4_9FUNG|nr:dolichyl-phosphate-mannose-protein mannosyltransferase [Thamnocephalis sphaerospora]|eukprot:RKP09865.1 dolichyl-phosphate-mannose-protein mannosyltransferase [Thamnocephalis sphaerospora]
MTSDTLRQRHVGSALAGASASPAGRPEEDADALKKAALPTAKRPEDAPLRVFVRQHADVIAPALLTLLSFWSRYYRLGWSNTVVWDEAHFGKFGSHYLKHDFYFDVHPPLGKVLVGLAGALAGYDGSFDFKSGSVYPEGLNYTAMRVILATFGALLVPLAYGTAHELGFSNRAAFLAGVLILCENALLVISRFILLDSMLLFFTALSLYTFVGFHAQRHQPFSFDWWLWLVANGLSLGMVSSVKWVGLFSVALVGLYTIYDLFDKLGHLAMPKQVYAKHWAARILCLIVIPMLVYMFSFWVHFALLYRSGEGDAQMSSLFQAGLRGNNLVDNPLELAYGSLVTVKSNAYGGGLLHSHVQKFPVGSQQQQVTTYGHKDENNNWMIARNWDDQRKWLADVEAAGKDPIKAFEEEEPQFIKDGDVIRLLHVSTNANLHSHSIEAPVTKSMWEVSGYGNASFGDKGDHWRVEVVDDMYKGKPGHVHSLTTRFHLRNVAFDCLLRGHNTHLPEWGFKQGEVVCDHKKDTSSSAALWNIEWHRNEKLPAAPRSAFRSSFLRDFAQLNAAMWTSNNALVPDDTRDDRATSAAWQWPLMLVGMRMNGWGDSSIKYLLLGNPAVWLTSTVAILTVGLLVVIYEARIRRGYHDWLPGECETFMFGAYAIAGGWFLHYMPFFIMGRVLYLHHYLPALYIAALAIPFLYDHFVGKKSRAQQNIVYLSILIPVLGMFLYFAPFSFGFDWASDLMENRSWLADWQVMDYRI